MRCNTMSQARVYIQPQGGNFEDYKQEDAVYHAAVQLAHQQLSLPGRVQVVPRTFIPHFIFGPDDIGLAVGQDGLAANTLKYMHGQSLVGVNPIRPGMKANGCPFACQTSPRSYGRCFAAADQRRRSRGQRRPSTTGNHSMP